MTNLPSRSGRRAALAFLVAAAAVCIHSQQRVFGEESCGDYGTALHFVSSPAAAAKQALEEQKLVFVLHVSGHFETPEYT